LYWREGNWQMVLALTKFVAKEDLHIVEKEVLIQAVGHPALVQLLSYF